LIKCIGNLSVQICHTTIKRKKTKRSNPRNAMIMKKMINSFKSLNKLMKRKMSPTRAVTKMKMMRTSSWSKKKMMKRMCKWKKVKVKMTMTTIPLSSKQPK